MHIPSPAVLVLIPLFAWRAVARFRRLVGRQRSSRYRHWIPLVLFPVLLGLMAFAGHAHGETPLLMAVGLGGGVLLGALGLRRTRFEPTKQGLFYTPDAHIGIALSLLFMARIAYRLVQSVLDDAAAYRTTAYVPGVATMLIFGMLAGYNMYYAIGMLRWRHRMITRARNRG